MKINELVEEKEYQCGKNKFRLEGKSLYFYDEECDAWRSDQAPYNTVINMDFSEIQQFTSNELALMKLMPDWAKWIAKDALNGNINIYEFEPIFFKGVEIFAIKEGECETCNAFSHVFTTIKAGEKYRIIRSEVELWKR